MAASPSKTFDFRFTYRLPGDDCDYVEEISFDEDDGVTTPVKARQAFERHWKDKGGAKVLRVELIEVLTET
jgi:hypothetical protein